MKKLLLLALSFAFSASLFAHGGDTPFSNDENSRQFFNQMNEIHEVMGNTAISGNPLQNGISFSITSATDSTIELIKQRFLDQRKNLDSYFENLIVTVDSLDNGIELTLESNDENTVKRLQAYGTSSVYRYLHSSFINEQAGDGFYGHMGYGPGMMNGYSNGMGSAYGNCDGSGYGPGANPNEPSSFRSNNGPMYRSNTSNSGYTPMMM